MAFWYSVRLSRRNVSVRPGSGCSAAARSSEPASEETTESYVALRRSRRRRRRHLACDQLPDDLLPDLRVPAHVLRADGVEGQSRRLVVAVVAFHAMPIDKPADQAALSTSPAANAGKWLAVEPHSNP